jgi:hypothetical protein
MDKNLLLTEDHSFENVEWSIQNEVDALEPISATTAFEE